MGSLRTRLIVLTAVCVLAIGSAVGYLVYSRAKQHDEVAHARSGAQTSLVRVQDAPHIVFRNTALGTRYGMVAMVPLSDPSGPRAITDTECDRVYAAVHSYVCLSSHRGVTTTYEARVLNADFKPTQTLPLTGIPSRARMSNDGTLAATTGFVAGDSYAGTSFSTRTIVTRVGGASYGSLENFRLIHNGQTIKPFDRNFWGVTFAPDDRTFYATAEWSHHTWLARGDLATRRIVTLHEDAECPSLSPDGKQIVFKQHGDLPPGKWRLAHYDITTGKVTLLAETRSVDDQVEWLDDSHVIYGLPRTGSQAAVDDVWSVPVDGTGRPKLLIPQAWSPAVIR